MKTAVIYARYSSDKQTEQSIEGQLRVCKDYAQRNDIVILDTYIDRAMTGKNDHRGSFQRMMKDSHKRQWDYVLVYKLDRFSRNKYETAMHKKTLRDNGIRLLSAMENIPETPEGIILESLLEGMAEYYSAELAQKVKRGRHETRLKGLFPGGGIMYGYRVQGRKLVVNEEEAEIVRYVFEQYALGVNAPDIIRALTERGIYFHEKPFTKNFIYHLLQNHKYTGQYSLNGFVYKDLYPRIISDELFERACSEREKNHFGKRSVTTVYTLRGLLICGYCGRCINGETGTGSNGIVMRYYKCRGRKDRLGCQKKTLPKEKLEELIFDALLEQLQTPSAMKSLTDGILQIQEEAGNNHAVLKQLYNEKKKAETTLQNIMAAVEKGVVTATTTSRLLEVETTIHELQKKITIEESRRPDVLTREDIAVYYKKALSMESATVIRYLIRKIVLFDDRADIYYNTPTDTIPGDGRGFCFYETHSAYVLYSAQGLLRGESKKMVISFRL